MAGMRGRYPKIIVKIPPNIAEDAIRSTPSNFLLVGIDPEKVFWWKAGINLVVINFGEEVEIIDPFTRERHRTIKKMLLI
ncbi:MAG: hypothetical protein R6U08_03100 [Bacillota bacterium]